MTTKVCTVCGAALTTRQQLYCSEACRAAAKAARTKASYKPSGSPGLYRVKTCPDCGIEFVGHIKSSRCKACQAEANKAADREHKRRRARGTTREIGSTDYCQRCNAPYTVTGGNQKYCPSCAEAANREHHAAVMRRISAKPEFKAAKAARRRMDPVTRTCCVCGKPYVSKAYSLTCSAECRGDHRAAYYAAYDANRRTDKAAYSRARWEALTDEERSEINRKARERYSARKNAQGGNAHV